jgi:hypothetical protein
MKRMQWQRDWVPTIGLFGLGYVICFQVDLVVSSLAVRASIAGAVALLTMSMAFVMSARERKKVNGG